MPLNSSNVCTQIAVARPRIPLSEMTQSGTTSRRDPGGMRGKQCRSARPRVTEEHAGQSGCLVAIDAARRRGERDQAAVG
jgi:hypothetical protein